MDLQAGSNTVKGVINDGMDAEFALKLGKKLGLIYGSPIAIAMDGRNSNIMLKAALSAGIMSVGCDVWDLGAVPTPMIQYYMGTHPEIKGGASITASFAGQDVNGFRIIGPLGVEDPIFEEYDVASIMAEDTQVSALKVGEMFKIENFTDGYMESIMIDVDVEKIRSAGFRICLDCRNQAVVPIVSELLMLLNIDYILIGGDSSTVDQDRMVKLGHFVKSQGLDMGIALEMDADHCMFTTADGVPVQGDKIFVLLAKSILAKEKGCVVMPVNSSTLMEDEVRRNGGTVQLCNVGEQGLVNTLKEHGAVFGGDIFGCYVIPSGLITCDALEAMVRMFQIIAENGPLSQLVAEYPDYYISRGSFEVPEEKIQLILDSFKRSNEGKTMALVDGIKIFNGDGWILVRHSNVRGVIKVYSQARTQEAADQTVRATIESFSKLQ